MKEEDSLIARALAALGRRYREHMEQKEELLASKTTDRILRDFEWGLEWTKSWSCASECGSVNGNPATYLKLLNEAAIRDSGSFFDYKTPTDFQYKDNLLQFTSAATTPSPENNIVRAQWFPSNRDRRRAVMVLPHWNAQEHHYGSLCRALQALGVSALRLSLPYHDRRMPPELHRADYAVSANVARTVDATRQAVIDARSCLDWLQTQGYERLGIVGTSLGACYAFLTSAHDKRLRVNVFNLFSLYFADVVWTGITTRHVRQGMAGHVQLEQLQDSWAVISPSAYLDRYASLDKKSLFISGTCDTTFLPKFSLEMIEQLRRRKVELKHVMIPCGHYTLGETPFKYIDGYQICSFILRSL
jgi:hypothetical protein